MQSQRRIARVRWDGNLEDGKGSVLASTSSSLDMLQMTWGARENDAAQRTSPEELIAAAHASCFAMSLAHVLGEEGITPTWLDVTATVTLERVEGQLTITSSALDVIGNAGGVDEAAFEEFCDRAIHCPVSRALGGVEVSLTASLSSDQLAAASGP